MPGPGDKLVILKTSLFEDKKEFFIEDLKLDYIIFPFSFDNP